MHNKVVINDPTTRKTVATLPGEIFGTDLSYGGKWRDVLHHPAEITQEMQTSTGNNQSNLI